MAIYTIQIKTVSRSAGHSALAKIAYNCRDKITDMRTGEIHKYNSAKMSKDLVHSEITYKVITLNKEYRSEIWNKAELAENRKDSRTAREYVVALPKELSTKQNIELVRAFAREITCKYNNVADWAIHNEKDGNGNIHAHILTTTREFNRDTKQLGERTAIEWNNTKCQKNNVPVTQEQIKEIRKSWETIQNKHLAMAGLDLAVSCERKEDRDMVRKHLGKEATALERKGLETELGDYNRTIDDVIQLERQVYRDSKDLARERAELVRLEKEKQEIEQKKQREEQLKQQELARQQEKINSDLLIQERVKQAIANRKASLEKPARNFISAKNRNKLFDIAREYQEFFTRQSFYEYEYWVSRHGEIEVYKTHINVNKQSYESIKLALDVAISQFGDKININGDDEFINAVIDIIATDDSYADVRLGNPQHQELLRSKRFDFEIEKEQAFESDNIDNLVIDVPDLDLDEPEQENEQVFIPQNNRGWDMDR